MNLYLKVFLQRKFQQTFKEDIIPVLYKCVQKCEDERIQPHSMRLALF